MNDKQRRVMAERQRRQAAEMAGGAGEAEPDGPPPEPPTPPRPIEEIAAEQRPPVGDGIPVSFMRFVDKTFQLPGMASGDTLTAKTHRIEFAPRLNAFLVCHINATKRTVSYDVVERSAVKNWRFASP